MRTTKRVLVVGTGRRAQVLQAAVRACPNQIKRTHVDLVGYVQMAKERTVITDQVLHVWVPLVDFVLSHHIDEVVIAVDDRRKALPLSQLVALRQRGVAVVPVEQFFERIFGFTYVPWLDPARLILEPPENRWHHPFQTAGKRVGDILLSTLLLLVVLVPWGVMWGWARTGRRPFWKHHACIVGKAGVGVDIYHLDPASLPAKVRPLGRWLCMAQWPYLWHILKGELSWIGPHWRAIDMKKSITQDPSAQPWVTCWTVSGTNNSWWSCSLTEVYLYHEPLRVRPGVLHYRQTETGLLGLSDTQRTLGEDLYYMRQWSLRLDSHVWRSVVNNWLHGRGATHGMPVAEANARTGVWGNKQFRL